MLAALDVVSVEVSPGLSGLVSDMGEVARIGRLASASQSDLPAVEWDLSLVWSTKLNLKNGRTWVGNQHTWSGWAQISGRVAVSDPLRFR